MAHPETPFENIENAQEYIELLMEAIEEAEREVAADIASVAPHQDRRTQALQLVAFKLGKLHSHMNGSRRILTDLRTLRRLLLGEREFAGPGAD